MPKPRRSERMRAKATMDKPVGENMGPANLYGMLTIIATILTFPFAMYYEGPKFLAAWKASTAVVGSGWLIRQMALDGFYYYAYNEVAFFTLNQVAPVTHSIANTFKRVAIILATVLVFGNKLSPLGAAAATYRSAFLVRVLAQAILAAVPCVAPTAFPEPVLVQGSGADPTGGQDHRAFEA